MVFVILTLKILFIVLSHTLPCIFPSLSSFPRPIAASTDSISSNIFVLNSVFPINFHSHLHQHTVADLASLSLPPIAFQSNDEVDLYYSFSLFQFLPISFVHHMVESVESPSFLPLLHACRYTYPQYSVDFCHRKQTTGHENIFTTPLSNTTSAPRTSSILKRKQAACHACNSC